MQDRPLRIAVLGLGFIGRRHAEIIARHPETQLVAIADIRSLEELDYQLPASLRFYPSLQTLLADAKDFDVLSICTPNGLHAQQSLEAMAAGLHVLCEKPMALRKSDGEKMLYASLRQQKHLFCVMQNRYSPPAIWLKNILEEKRLGQIFFVQINCFWNRDERYYKPNGKAHPWKGTKQLDGGTLFTQFSHFVDMLYWLFGDICDIQARFADCNHQALSEFEDSGILSFRLEESGALGSLQYSSSVWNKNMESSLSVIGSKGSVKIGGQYMNEITYCHIQDYQAPELPPANPPNDYGYYKGSAANHHYVIQNVVDVLKGRKSIDTNALEGLKVVEIIEKIYALAPKNWEKDLKNL